MKYLLDTDSVSFALRGHGDVGARIRSCNPSDLRISAITLAELRYGADPKRSQKLHALIDTFASAVDVVSFDEAAAAEFILTHHARPPLQMEGGTTFYFVTGGIQEALDRARDAANGMDVRIGGGPNTIQQCLRAGLIDELHVAISPVLLGGGERLFEGIDVRALGYECVQFVASEKATHVVIRRQGHNDD